MTSPKVFVAEFIGTFALVFMGAAAGITGAGLLGVALAYGLTMAVFAYAYGHISGTHLNPAVTLGHAANGNIKWSDAAVYWVAQFSGAALAAFILNLFLKQLVLMTLVDATALDSMATKGVFTAEHTYYALGLEALLTFVLVNIVLHTTVGGKAGPFAGWAVGTTLTIGVLAGGPLSGASMNPARSFGPAIFTQAIKAGTPDWQNPNLYLIYFVGPFIGAILAVLVYQLLSAESVSVEEYDEIEEVEVEEVIVEEKPAKKPAARKSTKK
ncbi:MAG: aquaporin [Chloroflexota bacterium]